MSEREYIEASLRRRSGPADKDAKHLSEFNNAQSDWYAWCPKCSAKLTGTLEQIKAHTCGK